MKTLAVIKNELFKDYLKIVSTDELDKVLDDPNIPVPFTCLTSVNNHNADELAIQLHQFFQQQKMKNKDFFTFDENQLTHLSFMLNLIQLSSGHTNNNEFTKENYHTINTIEEDKPTLPSVDINTENTQEPASENMYHDNDTSHFNNTHLDIIDINTDIKEPVVEETKETVKQEDNIQKSVEQEVKIENISESLSQERAIEKTTNEFVELPDFDDFDPFKIDVKNTHHIEDKTEHSVIVNAEPLHNGTEEIVAQFGIPKNAILHFSRVENVTATLVDSQHVLFENQVLTLNDAAKVALKKHNLTGFPNGLNNWLFNGETLKSLQERI